MLAKAIEAMTRGVPLKLSEDKWVWIVSVGREQGFSTPTDTWIIQGVWAIPSSGGNVSLFLDERSGKVKILQQQ